jgi:hypothetical protein
MLLFRASSTYTKSSLLVLDVSNKSIHKCEIQLIVVFGGECTHLSNAYREATLNMYNKLSVVCSFINIVAEQRCLIRKYSLLLGFS